MSGSDLPELVARVVALIGSGRVDLAAIETASACQRFPNDAELARLHGIALLQQGRTGEARTALERARTLAPDSVEVSCNLGSVLLAAGEPTAATAEFERAVELAPGEAAAWNGLGNARRAAGDRAGAMAAYAEALRRSPHHDGARLNLAAIAIEQGDLAAAESALARVTNPSLEPQRLLLSGHICAARRDWLRAAAAYAGGERLAPRDFEFAHHAGLVAEHAGEFESARTHYLRALSLQPENTTTLAQLQFVERRLYRWQHVDSRRKALRDAVAAGDAGVGPFAFLIEAASAAEQLACARTQASQLEGPTAAAARRRWHTPATGKRLRIGLLSGGFHEHPTALLVVALIEALADEPVEVHLFATSTDDGGPLRRRLRAAAHRFHECAGLAPRTAAETIHDAGIDVLADLDVWCGDGTPQICASRPAPVQVNWLGYPGTSGARWFDVILADRVIVPPEDEASYSERVVRLPRCYQPSDTSRVIGTPPPRDAFDLPDEAIVYACFNNAWKIDPPSFERMLAVLRGVPGSVLWLVSAGDAADTRLRGRAATAGVDAGRLKFTPHLPHADHLARFRHADLFLDTRQYNAHTTASDALWAGCPVLTTPGTTFASRVAASLATHLGLPELVAAGDAAFIEAAIAIGRDANRRATLQARVDAARSSSGLFDMRGYARDFAAAMRDIAKLRAT